MTLTKTQIVKSIRDRCSMTDKEASDAVEILLEIMKRSLSSGDDVLISGFGKFTVKQKNERRGRNPATGGSMTLGPRRVVTFRRAGPGVRPRRMP